MTPCMHRFARDHSPCVHPALGEGDDARCLWHRTHVRKSDAYVRELIEAALRFGSLREAHVVGARLPGIAAAGCDLRAADLRDADLRDADLSHALVAQATLRRADLRGCNLTHCDLSGCDLTGCRLDGANLHSATLVGCDLSGADLRGSDLSGADLSGAMLHGVRWNRRTIVAGTIGWSGPDIDTVPADADVDAEVDATRQVPPLTSLTSDSVKSSAETALSAPACEEPPTALASALASAAEPISPPRRSRTHLWWSAALAAGITGAALGGWLLAQRDSDQPHTIDTAAHTIRQLEQQHAATLAELTAQRNSLREALAASDDLRQRHQRVDEQQREVLRERDLAIARARVADAEALRWLGADDRAIAAQVTISELEQQLQSLAAGTVRQETLARILSQGVERLQADNARLTGMRDEQVALRHRLDRLTTERDRLLAESGALRHEREQLQARLARSTVELDSAQAAISRYLARLSASNLNEALGDDLQRVPMHAISSSEPLALAGRYALTLRVTPQSGSDGDARVAVHIVLQRPSNEGNPDITVLLYDDDKAPLRRVSLGFPSVDAGSPIIDGTASFSSARFPRFARVVVTPPTTVAQASAKVH